MGASYQPMSPMDETGRLYDALFTTQNRTRPLSTPATKPLLSENAVLNLTEPMPDQLPEGFALQLIQDRADIDISGQEFNFVRSIRVFDVNAHQRETGRDRDCTRSGSVRLGSYGTQGDFHWTRSSVGDLPVAHIGTERWGSTCPVVWHRSVFVEWRDYAGNYGYEQVNY